MNASEARERLEMMRKAAAETWKQVQPLEQELTAYRAVFLALQAFSPQMYGAGGSIDLQVLLDTARKSPAVQTVMQNRNAEVSKLIADTTTSMELKIGELKQPIGFTIPK
jgi:hypothetical protein